MNLYIDTNILLARYAPQEPAHNESQTLINQIIEGKHRAYTSTLTLVEIASTINRTAHHQNTYTPAQLTGAFLKKTINTKNLSIIPDTGNQPLTTEKTKLQIPTLHSTAIELATKTRLKTLDTLHIAAAYTANRLYGEEITHIVTLDEGILKQGKEIQDATGIQTTTPKPLL